MKVYTGIELLRFFSSLTIVIYHWGTSFDLMEMEKNHSFGNFLKILYQKGDYAVFVFFVISGVVFSNVYLTQRKNENFYNFFIKRFARLYPLHILTLFLIITIQLMFLNKFGNFELYTFNDIYHFVLNIFLILGWGLEDGRSFNTPVWTVSQEIFIYLLFFCLLIFLKKHKVYFIITIYLLFLIIDKLNFLNNLQFITPIKLNYFVEFVKFFYSGVLIFFIDKSSCKTNILLVLNSFLFIIAFAGTFKVHIFCFSLVLFFVLIDRIINYKGIKKILIFLGNLTYSMYLFHTFTFLTFLYLLKSFSRLDLFYLNISFILYIFFTIIISSFSFIFFEKKLNLKIRKNFIKNEYK